MILCSGKLICQSAETTQVGEQHCRLDVADVSALDGARHNRAHGSRPT